MSSISDPHNIHPIDDSQVNTPDDMSHGSQSPGTSGDGSHLDSRRVAKNTIMLYLRTIIMTAIGIYTSRVVLQTLGVSDYGINSAVGGLVGLFSIITSSLSMAVGRFLTFELGRGDKQYLKQVFSTSMNIMFALAALVVLLTSTIGWWFVNYQMNIPDGRMGAANWVLICCILSFAVGLVNVPYNSSIIAHEKMGIYAYMTILDAFFRLAIVFALYISPYDKLKTYSLLGLFVSLLMRFIYYCYCKKNFEECSYKFVYNKKLIRDMTKFAGWSFFGNGAWILNTQGVNILINVFFGVTLNAARGIATQVEGLVSGFVNNFMTALNPQITKLYAAGDLPSMHVLVCRGARFSFFLMMFFGIPCCLETRELLTLWLGIVPDYTVLFVRLSFVASICTMLGNTLVTAQFATGNIKRYQLMVTFVGAWVFPLTWLAFKLGGDPSWTYIVYSIVYFILVFVRIYLVKDMIQLSWVRYVKDVLIRSGVVAAISIVLPMAVYLMLPPTLYRFALVWLLSFICSGTVIYWVGMDAVERDGVKRMITKFIHRH